MEASLASIFFVIEGHIIRYIEANDCTNIQRTYT